MTMPAVHEYFPNRATEEGLDWVFRRYSPSQPASEEHLDVYDGIPTSTVNTVGGACQSI